MQELGKHSNINIKASDIGNKGAPSGIVFDPLTAKLEHAVPGKEDRTTATRQACLGIGGNTPKLYTAFDLTENKIIPNRSLNEAQKKYIIQQYLSGQAAVPNATETWQANQISKPLIKVAEEIRQTDPLLVQEVSEFLENKPARKPMMQQIKDVFTNISNKIGQFIENNIISKSQVQKIKNFFTNTSNSGDKTKNVVNNKGLKVSIKTDIKMSDGVKIAGPMDTPVRENFSHTKNNSKSR